MGDDRAPGDSVSEDRQIQYINAMLAWAQDDVRQVQLRVTAGLTIAVVFVTQLPFDRLAAIHDRWLLFVGVGLVVASATLHSYYLAGVHRSRRDLAWCLKSPTWTAPPPKHDANAAGDLPEDVWMRVWNQRKWLFVSGDLLLLLGMLALGGVLIETLATHPSVTPVAR